LVSKYLSIKWLKKNDYLSIKNFKEQKCSLLNWKNKIVCELFKKWDINKLSNIYNIGTYDYVFLKSIFDNKNECNILKDEAEKEMCNNYFYSYINIDNIDLFWDILEFNSFQVGKMISDIWKENFIKKLNNEFLEKCFKLKY
jgi:hypothetical protein